MTHPYDVDDESTQEREGHLRFSTRPLMFRLLQERPNINTAKHAVLPCDSMRPCAFMGAVSVTPSGAEALRT